MGILFPKSQSVTRTLGSFDSNGIWVVTSNHPYQFLGSVQPADSSIVHALAPGRENDGAVMIFSDRRLQVSSQNSNASGDMIVYMGLEYELCVESAYDNGVIPHFHYLAFSRGPA